MADKTYSETVIKDEPFPQSADVPITVSGDSAAADGSYSETKVPDQDYPSKLVARELIGTSIDTQSRKILQEFQFAFLGAFQIGKYENGVSGDIRITPSGLVARNSLGDNTITVDGDTGDITVKGTIRASTFEANNILTGQIDVGTGANNSYVRIDGANNRILVHDGSFPRIVIGNV